MSTTVGHQLRQRRLDRSLSLEQVSQGTRIKPHYLQALEDGELDALPSTAHARGFIRSYAGFLGLDAIELLAILDNKTTVAAAEAAPSSGPVPQNDAHPDGQAATPVSSTEPASVLATERAEDPGASGSPPAADGQISPQAAAIFIELGSQLKRQRELLGLSLADVERHTHLREHYLLALEAGNLDGLPSPVQGRGMLNNYAAFLGMNPEPLMLRFAEGLQARLSARQSAQQTDQAAARRRKRRWLPRRLRRLLSGDVLIGGVLTVFLGLVVLWISIRIFAISTAEASATPTAPSIAEVLLATPSPTLAPTGAAATESPPAQSLPTQPPATDPVTGLLLTPSSESGLQVYINVRQRAWLRVTVDGKVQFEDRVIPGSAYPFTGESTVEVLTSSGSAIQVFVNGADMGVLGPFGGVVGRIYSAEGVLTPTPSITPTPAPTVPVTPTPPAATELPGAEQPEVP